MDVPVDNSAGRVVVPRLRVDQCNATHPGKWESLEFEQDMVSWQINRRGTPIIKDGIRSNLLQFASEHTTAPIRLGLERVMACAIRDPG